MVFKKTSCKWICNGTVLVIISNPAVGVFSLIGPSLVRAHLWIWWDFFSNLKLEILPHQTLAAYIILGLIIPVYIHWVSLGDGPTILLNALLICIISLFALSKTKLKWLWHFSPSSNKTPRYFVLICWFIIWLFSFTLGIIIFLSLLLKSMEWDLLTLNFDPFSKAQTEIWSMNCSMMAWVWLRLLPRQQPQCRLQKCNPLHLSYPLYPPLC